MYYITTPTTLCVPYQNMTHRTQINLLFTLKCYNIHVHVYFFILIQNTMWLNTKDSFIATTFYTYIRNIGQFDTEFDRYVVHHSAVFRCLPNIRTMRH